MNARFVVALATIAGALLACGGASTHPPGTGDGGPVFTGPDSDGGAVSCPASLPAPATSCDDFLLECEYGSDPDLDCNTQAACQPGGWVITPAQMSPSCPTSAPGAGGCPATYAGVAVGTACGMTEIDCAYPQGMCACAFPEGPVVGPGQDRKWFCEQPAQGCPEPRPKLGTACATEQQSCDYGTCSIPGGNTLECLQGAWTVSLSACAD